MRLLLAIALASAAPAIHHTSADTKLAQSSLLTAKNLGSGWSGTASPQQGARFACKGFAPSGAGIVESGAASSPDFQYGKTGTGPFLLQKTSVYRTAAQANAYWKRAVEPGLVECAAQTLQAVESQGVKVTISSKKTMPFKTSVSHSALYRVVGSLKTKSNKLKTYLDVIVIGSGRTITEVTITSFVTPPPAKFEQIIAHDVIGNLGGPPA